MGGVGVMERGIDDSRKKKRVGWMREISFDHALGGLWDGQKLGALPSVLTFLVAKKSGFLVLKESPIFRSLADYALWTSCTLEKSRARLKAAAEDVATSLVKTAF